MNQYPTLLRRLGLAIDFIVEKGVFDAAANAALRVEVKLPPAIADSHAGAGRRAAHADAARRHGVSGGAATPARARGTIASWTACSS